MARATMFFMAADRPPLDVASKLLLLVGDGHDW